MSNSINLLFMNELHYLESSLHTGTLLVAMSGKSQTSFQVVKNNLYFNSMHKFEYVSETVYSMHDLSEIYYIATAESIDAVQKNSLHRVT